MSHIQQLAKRFETAKRLRSQIQAIRQVKIKLVLTLYGRLSTQVGTSYWDFQPVGGQAF